MSSPNRVIQQRVELAYRLGLFLTHKHMIKAVSVTQKDVARAYHVHPSTVCLALQNSPSIPAETRQKIQALARRLGYQPNAAASNLAALRSLTRRAQGSLPIAWINQEASRDFWRTDAQARIQWEHARAHASELGFHLDEFWLRESCMSAARLSGILDTRGISGVLFPISRANDCDFMQFLAGRFSCVAFNDYASGDWVDTVCADTQHNVRLTFDNENADINERPDVIASVAVELLVGKMRRHEITPPEDARRCLIKGVRREVAVSVSVESAAGALACA